MKEEEAFEIRFAHKEDWEDAMGLAWKTFLEFEAGDYAPEGIRSLFQIRALSVCFFPETIR